MGLCPIYRVARGGLPLIMIYSMVKSKTLPDQGVSSVGREGVEPSRYHYRRILSPLRLPIPPSPRQDLFYPNW